MKVVLLAGGYGTRLSEETELRPKPMVEVGGKPLLWHIMKIFSHHGHNDFVVCLGYKGYVIKEYFSNYLLHQSDVTIDVRTGALEMHQSKAEPWRVTLVDTGLDTMTGGRLARVRPYVEGETFFMTYGDGVASVDLHQALKFHREHGRVATLTAVQPPGRFGALDLASGLRVERFMEKPKGDKSWINGGFFILSPPIFDYLEHGDATVFEQAPLEGLAADGELMAFKHDGFWHSMDTLRDRKALERLWATDAPPWKVWSD